MYKFNRHLLEIYRNCVKLIVCVLMGIPIWGDLVYGGIIWDTGRDWNTIWCIDNGEIRLTTSAVSGCHEL